MVPEKPWGLVTSSSILRACESRYAQLQPWLLAISVLSGVSNVERRAAIRRTWFRFIPGSNIIACFGVGGRSDALLREGRSHRDILLMNATAAATGSMYETSFGWWLSAARHFRRATFYAKTDDDAFLHIPRLEVYLRSLECTTALHFGHLVYASQNPHTGWRCIWGRGWDPWGYKESRCAAGGAHPPVPYAIGALVVLSRAVARWMAHSKEVGRAATTIIDRGGRCARVSQGKAYGCGEDAHVGFWASRAPMEVTYVRANWQVVHDLHCGAKAGSSAFPASVPTNLSIVVHKLKEASAMEYIWDVFVGGQVHNVTTCEASTRPKRIARELPTRGKRGE